MAETPLFKKLRKRAEEAVDDILGADSPTDAIGAAVKQIQKGRRTLDEGGAKVLTKMGLATADDLERVNRRIGRLRKRLRGVLERVS